VIQRREWKVTISVQVLVADDDPVARFLIERVLQSAGYDVVCASDGAEAARMWLADRPQLVVTDWVMPGLDGSELCGLIRGTPAERYTYIMLVTIRADSEWAVAGLGAGADDYITKPFDSRELLLRVGIGRRTIELEGALASRVLELQQALEQVRTLEGLLPICSYCRKVRDVGGYWDEIESYVEQHTDAVFTHGLCPACLAEHAMPELEELRRQQAARAGREAATSALESCLMSRTLTPSGER